jgi:tRNA1(Val) A37 N6-methylase TrmN6
MIIKEGERIDELQRNGYRIIQKTNGFCFGMDAVLLSGFASVKPGEKALDLGTGTGIIPILLEAKTEGSHFTGLEIQAEMAEIASRSVALNWEVRKLFNKLSTGWKRRFRSCRVISRRFRRCLRRHPLMW